MPPPPPPPVGIHCVNEIRKHEIGNSRIRLKQYKEQLHLTPKIKEIGLGVMLGDASLQTQNNGATFRLKFEGGNKNRAYIQHLRDEFDLFYGVYQI
jgi:hypothetical protein